MIEAVTRWFALEYGRNQGLLRAQIRRALDNPSEWQPFQKAGREFIDGAIRILERYPDIQRDADWQRRVRIAMQIVLGTLNNAIINRPGPLELTDKATSRELQPGRDPLSWLEMICDKAPHRRLEAG